MSADRMTYDHRKRAAKWGMFLAYLIGAQHGHMRRFNQTLKIYGMRPCPAPSLFRDVRKTLKAAVCCALTCGRL